jgi:hypothetical protein
MDTYEKLLHLKKEVWAVKLEEATVYFQGYQALMNQRYEEAAENRQKQQKILEKLSDLRKKLCSFSGQLNIDKFPMKELDLWEDLWEELDKSDMQLGKKFKGFQKGLK